MVKQLSRDRNGYGGRKPSGRLKKRKVFIYCEGETEKYYFDMLSKKYSSFTINTKKLTDRIGIKTKVVGNKGPIEIVKEASRTLKSDQSINEIHKAFVVFDNDNYSKQDIQEAIDLAKKNDLTVIYSNINFDLWILMHFESVTCYLSTQEINRRLTKHYGVISYSNEVKGEAVSLPLRDKVIYAYNNAINLFKQGNAPLRQSIECNPYINIHNYLHEIYQVEKI